MTRILVMRHAEKPDDPTDPHLTPAGQQRAQDLVAFIQQKFGKPDFIFATAKSKHSDRPCETVEPLSMAINVAINNSFADQDYGALAEELRTNPSYQDKLTVVSWHHGNIPNLINALGVPAGHYPDPWPRYVFNLILQVDWSTGTTPTVAAIGEPF